MTLHTQGNLMRNLAFIAVVSLVINAIVTWVAIISFISYYLGGA